MTRDRRAIAIAGSAWLIGIALGFAPLLNYAAKPGDRGVAPARIPMTGETSRARLLMVLHPRCACSRASLRELERLLARVGDKVTARAIMTGEDAETSALLALARSIDGLEIDRDPHGDHARSLGAVTSGETYLYAPDGTLLFHGGLTAARGHEGATDSQDAIVAALTRSPTHPALSHVFGCRLEHTP